MEPPRGPVRWLDLLRLRRPNPKEAAEWELEHHVAELADRLAAEGLPPEEARHEAERRLGGRTRHAHRMRRIETRRLIGERLAHPAEVLSQALTGAVRSARRQAGFTLTVVLTMGLGIGANATMFSIVDRLLLSPPEHIVEPERVRRVFIEAPNPFTGGMSIGSVLTYPDYVDLQAHAGLTAVAAYTPAYERTVGGGANASRARVALASVSFFPLLGVAPTIGRFYGSAEALPGSTPTAVLGGAYWRSVYGADPGVIGRTIEISGRAHTIVGVTPPDFTGVDLGAVDVWLPLELTRSANDGCLTRNCWWMMAVARLNDGVGDEAAEAEATRLYRTGWARDDPSKESSARANLVLGSLIAARGPDPSEESRVAGWLAAVSLIVLLIACTNVANLLMARATRRRREIGVQLAIGASRSRLAAQTLVESLLLSLVGAALAVALARWGGRVVRTTLLTGVQFPDSTLTGRLLGFTFLVTIVAGLCSGIAPAVRGSRLAEILGEGTLWSSARRSSLRGTLIVSQVAMCVLLLVGAGLFVRSLAGVRAVDLGLDVDHLLLARLEFRSPEVEPGRQTELYEDAIRAVTAIPGVQSAAATGVPFRSGYAASLRAPGLDSIPQLPGGGPYQYPVSARYFETVGLAITRGRPIDARDVADQARVVVVSETMARTLWPDRDALNQCLAYGAEDTCARVVGVVEDAARSGLQDAPFMAVYYPSDPAPLEEGEDVRPGTLPHQALYVRAEGEAQEIAGDVAARLRSFSPEIRFADVETMSDIIDPQARTWTLGATMFTIFGLLALVLAAVGLYGVLAFDVAQRTRELGIRTALGARRARLLRSVLAHGTGLVAVGVLVGLAAAYAAAPYLRDLLFEVSPRDPTVLGGVAALLMAVSIAASLVPALRATRVDPTTALRSD